MTRSENTLAGVRFQFEGIKRRTVPPVGIDAAHNLQNHEEQGYYQRNDQLCLNLYRTQKSRSHYSRPVNLFPLGLTAFLHRVQPAGCRSPAPGCGTMIATMSGRTESGSVRDIPSIASMLTAEALFCCSSFC